MGTAAIKINILQSRKQKIKKGKKNLENKKSKGFKWWMWKRFEIFKFCYFNCNRPKPRENKIINCIKSYKCKY